MNEEQLQTILRSHVMINQRDVELRVLKAMKDAIIASKMCAEFKCLLNTNK